MGSHDDALLAEQIAYYRAGAAEYDRPYAERQDLQDLLTVTEDLPIGGDVLELACGTGQWTTMLAARARSVTAVDAAAETLAIARSRAASPHVRFVQADMFEWQPPRRYDTVFFVLRLLALTCPAEAAREEMLSGRSAPAAVRRLDDGSRYRIVKVFHDPRTLTDDLTALGWSARIRTVAGKFTVGVGHPRLIPSASFR
ncbi:class I SAM-dependent methyltransferase [Streptomyces sp. NPDC086554]|uniref:class I SAM-dependent methyltransferase n=1 Tax=Streptomyces sp. NPDC086554 TaxID=3154864 RepID=UPI003440D374